MTKPVVFNILGFNLSWLGLVFFGNESIPFVSAWLCCHFYYIKNRKAEIIFVTVLTTVGISLDSILVITGVFNFEAELLIPYWLMVLWFSFSATVNVSLTFLENSKRWQAAIGAIFPATSYIAGAALNRVELTYSETITYFILSPIWAGIFIFMFVLRSKLYGKEISNA